MALENNMIATCKDSGHSNIWVNCCLRSACAVHAGRSETTISDYIKISAKVDLLKTEKILKNGKCRFRSACAECREFSKWVENNVGKGEIAPTVFSEDLYCRHVKTRACLGKG